MKTEEVLLKELREVRHRLRRWTNLNHVPRRDQGRVSQIISRLYREETAILDALDALGSKKHNHGGKRGDD